MHNGKLFHEVSRAEQIDALRLVLDTILEALAEAGETGITSTRLYSTLSMLGLTFGQYSQIMFTLRRTGKVEMIGGLITLRQVVN